RPDDRKPTGKAGQTSGRRIPTTPQIKIKNQQFTPQRPSVDRGLVCTTTWRAAEKSRPPDPEAFADPYLMPKSMALPSCTRSARLITFARRALQDRSGTPVVHQYWVASPGCQVDPSYPRNPHAEVTTFFHCESHARSAVISYFG
ncbi:hypothetical protein, partial [Mycobacterium attenuatum]|uniref:hypothetical protein n=1 Tax=Mycobacterium attenuatum TaxID=2341086 RepID=UPI001B7D64DB